MGGSTPLCTVFASITFVIETLAECPEAFRYLSQQICPRDTRLINQDCLRVPNLTNPGVLGQCDTNQPTYCPDRPPCIGAR